MEKYQQTARINTNQTKKIHSKRSVFFQHKIKLNQNLRF